MTTRAPLLLPSLLLLSCLLPAACSSTPPSPAPPPPPPPAPAAEAAGPEAGLRAPSFSLPALGFPGTMTLEDALARQGGKPLVLVLGAASCSISTQEMEEMAAAGLAGPGGDPGVVFVVQGTPAEVLAVAPKKAAFPVLVDGDGSVLTRYLVASTPSIVVLDGSGRIAYIGSGGYIPVPAVKEMAAAAGRGEAIDPASVIPEGG